MNTLYLSLILYIAIPVRHICTTRPSKPLSTELTKKPIFIDRGTRYNPSENQCDDSPYNTADGSYIDTTKLKNWEIRWCALSWDLIDDKYRRNVRNDGDWAWNGSFKFGDTILVHSDSKPMINGEWILHDVMNKRYRKSIDFLYHEENMAPKLGVCKDIEIVKV